VIELAVLTMVCLAVIGFGYVASRVNESGFRLALERRRILRSRRIHSREDES